MLIHYPPSYYHLHVHIYHIKSTGYQVGQAHLLDDVIDNLELECTDPNVEPHYARRTLTYGLVETHGTYDGLQTSQ